MKNEILQELWRHRDAFAEQYHYDIDAMVTALRRMENHPLTKMIDRRKTKSNKSVSSRLKPCQGNILDLKASVAPRKKPEDFNAVRKMVTKTIAVKRP